MNRPAQALEIEITGLGAMADGVATAQEKPVYVPFTCPGDKVQALVTRETKHELRARLQQIIAPSPERQTPPCQHFGRCGGCKLQHVKTDLYRQFKHSVLTQFIAGLGLDTSIIQPLQESGAHSRRRVTFTVVTHRDSIQIGFMEAGSHRLIDVQECPVSEPALAAMLPDWRACLGGLKKPGRVSSIGLTALEHGIDAVLTLNAALGTKDKETLIAFAEASPLVRLTIQVQPKRVSRRVPQAEDPVTLYDTDQATITFADVEVMLPPGAFLQATRAGQEAITAQVVKHLQHRDMIADLYSGCGTYSFPLIQHANRVSAYEGVSEMAAAMNNACVRHGLDERMQTTVRDLFSDPLSAEELNAFDGVVINPPRNGALPQVKQIGKSKIRQVVMVSCDPSTFKRDASALLAAGYTLTEVTPIDQFTWSHHLEVVAAFHRH